jgi:hypothetical protein
MTPDDTYNIHTCHDNCQRIACVLRRELTAMTEQRDEALKEIKQLKQKPCEFCRELPQTENEKAYCQEFSNTLGQLPSINEWLQNKTQTEQTK